MVDLAIYLAKIRHDNQIVTNSGPLFEKVSLKRLDIFSKYDSSMLSREKTRSDIITKEHTIYVS